MWFFRLLAVSTMVIAFNVYAERTWVNLGKSALGPWKIFIDSSSLKEVEPHVYAAVTYEDLGVLQRGLDEYDSKGNHSYNTRIRYRTYSSLDVYDCKNKRIANIQTRYYTGDKPSKSGLVHRIKEENPIWSSDILEPKFFAYVCRDK